VIERYASRWSTRSSSPVAESLGLIRRLTGADEVVFLNWMPRDRGTGRDRSLPPAPDVHVDLHTSAIAERYARKHAASALAPPQCPGPALPVAVLAQGEITWLACG
jgi:hypothetical protein